MLALAREIRSPIWIGIASAALASTLIAQGELEAASSLLADEARVDAGMRAQGQRLRWVARAELALARGQPDEAMAIIDRLYAATTNLRTEGDVLSLALTKAAAFSVLRQFAHAEALLRAALSTALQQGTLPTARLVHLELAKLAHGQGRHEEALAATAAAREIAQRLATTIPEGELWAAFCRRAVLEAPVATAATQGESRAISGNLTPREQEVARHIAAGHSNRQIADDLFVSERTVEAHVTNILRKLSLTSRAGIAAWAERVGVATAT